MTTITREQQKQILIDTANHVISRDNTSPYSENLRELARIELASLEAEPAGYHVIKECGKVGCSVATLEEAEKTRDFWNKKWTIRPYFYTAQPAPERERIRREHAEWSDKTFGDVGPVGPLKHLSKEALEAAADPSDPLEWADMQFLLWDAQRRMGISDEFITRAMIEKLEINKTRQWPEPKDGEPQLHIKEQPAPVVLTDEQREQLRQMDDEIVAELESEEIVCRAAMLQANQRDLSQPVGPQVAEYEQIMLQAGNSPVSPDGWISSSERMPAQDDWVLIYSKYGEYLAGQVQGEYVELNDGTLSWLGAALHWMPLPEPPLE
ncbi:TPA: dATP/dGTP pyrophosphohydrolase domain-containing protein [Salmonella enterica subsp. enterica serovar Eastbourne]